MDRRLSSGPLGLLLLLLAALTTSALGQTKTYFAVGELLTLSPPPRSSTITSVVWTHNTNLVAEWLGSGTDYYGLFKGRANLNMKTGILEIAKTTLADEGNFKVEINTVDLDEYYVATAIKKVTQPDLVLRTLSCTQESPNCNFTCKGETTGVGPVTYSWRLDRSEWEPEQESPEIILIKQKVKHGKLIQCRMKNPLSHESSNYEENPLYHESHIIVTSVCIVAVLIVASCGTVGFWKREFIKTKFSQFTGNNSDAKEDGEAAVPMN